MADFADSQKKEKTPCQAKRKLPDKQFGDIVQWFHLLPHLCHMALLGCFPPPPPS